MRGQWRVDRRCEMNLKSGFKGSGDTKHSPFFFNVASRAQSQLLQADRS